MKKYLLLFVTFCALATAKSQNLVLNSDMNVGTNWGNACPELEVALVDETAYGGTNGANFVAEIDALSCLQQTVPGLTHNTGYMINFQATRRIGCPETPANPGIKVKVTGVISNTVYSEVDYHYSNVTWTGYTSESQYFVIPNAASDEGVRIDITSIDNIEGCGIIMDNFTMVSFGTLPINLSGFNAAAKGSSIDLSWTTSAEVNSAYFTVLRSKNGVNFEEVGKVNAAGFGSTYSINDAQPGAGVTFYKLKIVDKNGLYKFSDVVRVNLGIKDLDVRVYPTIVSDVLNYVIENPKATKLSVVVTDLSGKRVNSSVQSFANGTTQKTINVATLASGVYFLTIVDETNGFKKSVLFKKN